MDSSSLVLHLGSNKGNREIYLHKALEALENAFSKPIEISQLYQTAAWGIESQQDFLNIAAVYSSNLEPKKILLLLKTIERKIGRKPNIHWREREIDIDIIFYGNKVFKSHDLEIPHTLMHLRKFVLLPLAEIIPYYIHPVFSKNVKLLLEECNDPLYVKLWKKM